MDFVRSQLNPPVEVIRSVADLAEKVRQTQCRTRKHLPITFLDSTTVVQTTVHLLSVDMPCMSMTLYRYIPMYM